MILAAPLQDRLIVEQESNAILFHFKHHSWIEERTAEPLGELMLDAIQEPGREAWVAMQRVEFCNGPLLGKLIRLKRHLSDLGGKLHLVGVQGMVREVFEITRLDKYFPIREDLLTGSLADTDPLEATFVQSIRAEPGEKAHWYAYTDWLEDQDDPRAAFLRLQDRLPENEPRVVPAPAEAFS